MSHLPPARSLLCWALTCLVGSALAAPPALGPDSSSKLVQVARLKGGLSPKSVVWNGHDRFFVQNMMYRHTVTVYDADFQHCGTISDRVSLEDLGMCEMPGSYRGAPVECAFTSDGRFAFVSNYSMEGAGFNAPGCDDCTGKDYDGSFIYQVDASTLEVVKAYPTGSVPKYLVLTPDQRQLLVSNWSSGDLSLIDLVGSSAAIRIPVGRFPRGIALDPDGRFAYIAIMGSNAIKRMDLLTHTVEHFVTVGKGPRHLCLDAEGRHLYASLNHEGSIVRIDLESRAVEKLHVGGTPRSMVFGRDERSLYVVNYSASRMTKVDLGTFSVVDTVATDAKPIGVTYDARNQRVWVACYSGSVQVFEDRSEHSDLDLVSRTGGPVFGPADSCLAFLAAPRELPTHPLSSPASTANARAEGPASARQGTPAPIAPGRRPSGKGYAVVAGSFREPGNAQRQRVKLEAFGYDPQVVEMENGLHQVLAGAFDTEQEAKALGAALEQHGVSTWMYKPER